MKKFSLISWLLSTVILSAYGQYEVKLTLTGSDQPDLQINFDDVEETTHPRAVTLDTQAGLVTPAFQNAIHNDDLQSTDTTPLFTIRASGRYYLAGNIFALRPTTTTGVVFSVAASNVTLDLNNKTIAPHVSSAQTSATAIDVATGASNVMILNGTIQGVDSNNVQRFARGISINTAASATINHSVKLQNVAISRCTIKGIYASSVNGLSLENCSVNGISNSNAIVAADLNAINALNIKNCFFINNSATGNNACTGVGLVDCVDGNLENVLITGNQATGVCRGLSLNSSSIGCKNLHFKQVNSSNNSSSATGAVVGVYVNNSPNNYWEDCIISNNSHSGASTVNGVDISGNSSSCRFTNCHINRNSANSQVVYGLACAADNLVLENCTFNGNVSSSNHAYGVSLSSNSNKLTNCQLNFNNSAGGTDTEAYGLYMSNAANNLISNCQAIGNRTSSTVDAGTPQAAGFYTTGGKSNRFEKCLANGNSANQDGAVIGAGYIFAGAETRSLILNSEALRNSVGDGTDANGGRCYGVYFAAVTGATSCVVRDCYIAYNNIAGSGGLNFGLYDNNATSPDGTSTSTFLNNLVVGHGRCLGSALNSSLQWNSNSEPTSSQNFFWKHNGTTEDPRNVIQETPVLNFLSISTAVGDWTNISVY